MNPHDQLMADYERLLYVLQREMDWRPQRPGTRSPSIDHMGRDVYTLEWIAKEHAAMRNTVNDLRVDRGLPVLWDAAKIVQAEQSARGHSDYAEKYALRCAELCQPDPAQP